MYDWRAMAYNYNQKLPKSLWKFYFKYALDSETEIAIQKSFDELARGRTTVAIAHRLSTLRNMDKIVVLNNGVVVEYGTHNQLLRRRGEYWRLWNLQSGGFIQE